MHCDRYRSHTERVSTLLSNGVSRFVGKPSPQTNHNHSNAWAMHSARLKKHNRWGDYFLWSSNDNTVHWFATKAIQRDSGQTKTCVHSWRLISLNPDHHFLSRAPDSQFLPRRQMMDKAPQVCTFNKVIEWGMKNETWTRRSHKY